jgi:diaminopimelate dehydrogenase
MPHGGSIFRNGATGFASDTTQVIEYRLDLGSNPEFTSSVLLAYARAAHRLTLEGNYGCKTVLDIAPAYLLAMTPEEQRASLL